MSDRPIERGWECKRSGDCCRIPAVIVMTAQERVELLKHPAAAGRELTWEKNPQNSREWALKAGPCPFLDGKATCSVYDKRPTNCRIFGCFRPNPAAEPFEENAAGCLNLNERKAISRDVRRGVHRLHVRSRQWAAAHGYTLPKVTT